MYRKKDERAHPDLAGDDPYAHQLPLNRAIPLWGGISEGGFAEAVVHPKKKLKVSEWVECVREGEAYCCDQELEAGRQKWALARHVRQRIFSEVAI